jgi:hypothetical protein
MPKIENPCDTCEIELRHCPLYPEACKKRNEAGIKAVVEWLDTANGLMQLDDMLTELKEKYGVKS